MQGLITLDFGNTHPHAGLFQKLNQQWELIKVIPLSELPIYLDQLQMDAHNSSVVLCEVRSREEEIIKLQERGFLVTRLKDYWRGQRFAGMPVNYASTLGEDRLISAYYCYKHFKEPTLLIDAGTFVTMDVISSDGFLGGYIIPGIDAYFATYEKGEQLKAIPLSMSLKHTLPHETAEAMTESYSAFAELARRLTKDYDLKKITLTGGQTSLWEGFFQQDKSALKIEGHPHLLHWALKHWFTTQIEPL